MIVILVALLSGALSVLTPCVLPLLPAILATSSGSGRRRPLGIVLGLVTSFTVALIAFSAIVRALGVPSETLRWVSAGVLVVFGIVLLSSAAQHVFERASQVLVRRAPTGRQGGDGFWGGAAAGSGLGLAWAPCVGPIVAGVAVASSTATTGAAEVARAIAFAVGMSVPLFAIVFGGRRVAAGLRSRIDPRRIQVVAGVVLIVTAVFIGGGYETRVNRFLSEKTGISSTLTAGLESKALDAGSSRARGGAGSSRARGGSGTGTRDDSELDDLGRAPAIEGATQWINTPDERPLSLASLRGKVVLVDFWTYSCINCLRTLPHVKGWYSRYEQAGLVVLGIHAPEFEFEKDEGNVRDAVRELGIEYPVAMDNDFTTWRNFDNQYWPAKYLIDRDGRLRYTHFGEGDYDVTEAAIRSLLGVDAGGAGSSADTPMLEPSMPVEQNQAASPETYVGSARAQNFAGRALDEDAAARGDATDFEGPDDDGELGLNQWYFDGTWRVSDERAVAARNARIVFHYRAADVYLVLGPERRGGRGGTVRVHDPAKVDGGDRTVHVTGQKLYTLRHSDRQQDATLTIDVPAGVAAYAFTFG